jgi:hypothetical protein
MPPVLNEGSHIGEFILSEAEGWLSRDTVTVTVPANTTLRSGQVMEVSAGKHITLATTNNAASILYSELTNATGAPVDMKGVVFVRTAEVRTGSLIGIGAALPAAGALAALKVLGLIAR